MQIIELFEPGFDADGMPLSGLIEDDAGYRWYATASPARKSSWRYCLTYGISGVRWSDGTIWDNERFDSAPDPDGLVASGRVASPQPRSTRPFVHLHTHSEYSALDGYSTITELVDAVVADGQDAVAITDHGVCAAHLELQKECQARGIKPIFGLEAYLVDDATVREPGYWHFILWAQTDEGLANLWGLSTEAHRRGFYYHPRMDWEMLGRYAAGIAASTACLRGPLSAALQAGDDEAADLTVGRLQAIYGDRLLLELHTNTLPEQRVVNEGLVALGAKHNLPLIVVADSHYACHADHDAHAIWLAMQTNKNLHDEADLFASDDHYHVATAAEVARAIDYLPAAVVTQAMANTVAVAASCNAEIRPRSGTPVYHRKAEPGSALQGSARDAERMVEICRANWDRWLGHIAPELQPVYEARFTHEVAELTGKSFCGYMLIVWDYCDYARRHRVLIGPGRGSAAGCLVSYLLGITGVDPIEADLLFERFISPGRTELPDIDIDFPASKRGFMTDYLVERWGEEHVVRVGTITRLKNRGVLQSVARVFKETEHALDFMDQKALAELITAAEASTAGKGLTWEELWVQEGELLEPYRTKYPEVFGWCDRLVGRIKSYGKHPAGIVIDPSASLMDSLPMRTSEDEGQVTTEFPMDLLTWLNLVKFDILTLRTLDTVQAIMDLIAADPMMEGFEFNPMEWREEYDDPQVWDVLCAGDTMGVFQIETSAGTRLTKDFQPRSLADLCAIGTLVRPGPKRSGITDAYIRRRHHREPISFAHPLLERVLHNTYGLMIYQEDIMATCQVLAGYSSAEADEVRSILGKKKVDKIPVEGQRFVSRTIANGVDQRIAETIWEQMKEFSKYAFNKSHSWSYGMLAYWCAWAKVHLPAHFLVAALSTVDKDRIPDFVQLARAYGYKVLPPDLNESDIGFSVSSDRIGVRYGLGSVIGLGESKAQLIMRTRPFATFLDLAQSKVDFGAIRIMAKVGALDSLIPEGHNRTDLLAAVEAAFEGGVERCAWLDPSRDIEGLPCGFDWASEVVIGKSGKPLKPKALPKKCNRACRHYTAHVGVEWPSLPAPTKRQMRLVERDLLGVYVSSTPFGDIDLAAFEEFGLATLSDVETGPAGEFYKVVAEIASVRTQKDRTGRHMAFLSLNLIDGPLDVAVFSSVWKDIPHGEIVPDAFGLFVLQKGDRGPIFNKFIPIIPKETP